MAVQRLNCVGEVCPKPVISTLKKMKSLAVGDVLVVETDNIASVKNVSEWAKKKGLPVQTEEIAPGEWEVYIEKK
ncbi:MAG: hypothetical protein PWQ96_487 [Clostridia bacterium]|nr:SirA family protein [Clostridiales bacterium]MDK2984845.1 hypothetical protein [Clostridia bacterium]